MERLQGLIGIIVLLGLAFLLSNNKRKIDKRVVIWGLSLQLFFALIIIVSPIGKPFFQWFDSIIKTLLDFSVEGSTFLFASFGTEEIAAPLRNFAFVVLPTVIFFSALMAMLYHFGIMQRLIKIISIIMQKTMGTSGAETTSVSANIFIGQTEAPLVIKPFISKMTKSELMAIMVGGFATVAGGVMAVYVMMLGDVEGIAGHLLAASIMSAPAGLVIAKIIYPETEKTLTAEDIDIAIEKQDDNALEALARGSSDGLKLAANIGAMLIAFVAFVALLNHLLGLMFDTSIQELLGYLFMPLAWTMGAEWGKESMVLGSLMGQKIVLSELIAYGELSKMNIGTDISARTAIIASYALCGFSNFASIGIQLGGIGSIAPSRRKDLAKLVFKAMIGGALASWLTASIASIMITVPEPKVEKPISEFDNPISEFDKYITSEGTDITFSNAKSINENEFTAETHINISYVDWEGPNGIYDFGEDFIDLDSSGTFSYLNIESKYIRNIFNDSQDTTVYDTTFEDFNDAISYRINNNTNLYLSSVGKCKYTLILDEDGKDPIKLITKEGCIFTDNETLYIIDLFYDYNEKTWMIADIYSLLNHLLDNRIDWFNIEYIQKHDINKVDK